MVVSDEGAAGNAFDIKEVGDLAMRGAVMDEVEDATAHVTACDCDCVCV
jgi:hypothetical protein